MNNKNLKPSDYVHLHNHTQFSLLDGLTRIEPLVEFVNDQGMQAVAMTDHGTLSGTIEFYKEAKSKGIKPLIGIETYVAARKHTDKDPVKDKPRFHLILLAMNNQGYQNLMKLSTIANLDGFYYFARIDHDLLEKYNEGIIALSACMGGEIGDALKQDQYDRAKEVASWYKQTFGDRYYLEVQDHGHPKNPLPNAEQEKVNNLVFKLGKELDIPVVLTCDAHYLRHEDQDAHEILLCVGTGSYLSDEKRMSLKDYPLHVVPPAELIERWGADHPEIITNTKAIADRCDLEIELGKILIPKFMVPKGETEKSYLDKLVYRGLAWRYKGLERSVASKLSVIEAKKHLSEPVLERANYELGIIAKMGYDAYFLIVADFINWGKDNGIIFGPGRGSAAGSIVAYAMNITDLDPLHYDLLFERFLNPDRISMPDIDIDIQDTRRDEVIQYCVEKYGSERVANIVTFGRMFARNAVRDVARVLQVPYADADRLAKMIPQPIQGRHIPLAKSLQADHDLKQEYETNPISKQVLDQAMRLEGTVRSHGVHAAGVVIAPDDIVKFVPLEMAQKGVVATQFPMGPIEELGLLKMDFLGLSNLTIINNALRIIKKVYDKTINLSTLKLDDTKTFELLARGDTTGVFQLESAGMKRYLKELKPTVFDDIIAMAALYRPGPMQFIDDFIARKHGHKRIEYLHPTMENSLNMTYGVLVYQEQVMQIAKDMCGFTGGQADTLRKGVAKKKIEVLAKLKDDFINGALKTSGADRAKMEQFWNQLEAFAAYCFPKAHAACYATIAYQTAYLKAHYPAAFMAALMTSDYDDIDRLAIEISECKNMGIEVLQPDVNESYHEFAVVPSAEKDKKSQIRFGMDAIKNVGRGAVEEILRARTEGGRFETIEDFLTRVSVRISNRKALESLIKAGAFDRFADRSQLLRNIDILLAYANRVQKEANTGQTDLFGDQTGIIVVAPKLTLDISAEPYSMREQLQWERELLGIYLSQHPLSPFENFLSEQSVPLGELKSDHDGKAVTVGGIINDIREITTKNNQKMAFIKIADLAGEIELILFPGAYQQTLGIWERDRVVLVRGKVNAKDRDGNVGTEVKVMVDDGREVTIDQAQAYQPRGKTVKPPKPSKTAAKAAVPKSSDDTQPSLPAMERVYIRLENSDNQDLLMSLKQVIDENAGETDVVLVLGPATKKQIIKLPTKTTKDDDVIAQLKQLVGQTNVRIQ
jgi:DNA polymerase-3 subunit alpha